MAIRSSSSYLHRRTNRAKSLLMSMFFKNSLRNLFRRSPFPSPHSHSHSALNLPGGQKKGRSKNCSPSIIKHMSVVISLGREHKIY